ncbi:Phage portal protein, SPP1 Gp6-like protein [Lachnospiraceae bacterium TWA4]|nr:Phage portal protein, SPP1 Gp6-like protein [Lachnospiraceae bacterium TWA4]
MLKESEIIQFIREDMSSTKKRFARVGQKYYEAEHDILQYRMFYFNADGKLVEDKMRSNVKIPHPFFTELVDQLVQYMLSGKDGFIHSDISELQERLNTYFDDEFIAELSEVIRGASSKGFEYMYVYQNKDDRLAFQSADCMGVVEVRDKETDDGCAYVIYWYVDKIAKQNKTIKRIQVWDENQTYFYVQEDDGKLVKDESEPINPRPHITYKKDGDDAIYYDGFGFIPFFRLDNNKKQISDLKPIKSLIDDYDIMACGLSNNLADFDHPLHVVKGFQGDNLEELQQNLKTKKIVGVDEQGGIEVHTVDIPYQARLVKMQEDEKNIYRFGMGFNSAQLGDGNVTNVVIKSRYALLDLKANKLEIKLKQFLNKILKVVLAEINRVNGTDYQLKDVKIKFNREIMTNALDNAQIEKIDAEKQQVLINTILSLANTLDDETIIKSICDVLELDYEKIKGKIDSLDEVKQNQIAQEVLGGDS